MTTSREKHGCRIWWHFKGGRHRVIGVELGWWHSFCHAGVSVDDEGWNLSLALPPLFFHLSLEGFPIWQPQRMCVATWRTPPEDIWLTDQRECRIGIHDWTIWLHPWSKTMEWAANDPWWVRGVTFNLRDFVLGRTDYTCETLGPAFAVSIPMPEGVYTATFQPQRQTWTRPRWRRSLVRESFDIRIPKGIPFAGKGENSWDCGDDGLFGMGAEGTVEQAVATVRESVMARRHRYGAPSEDAIREALA
jgi:hypothetical protein